MYRHETEVKQSPEGEEAPGGVARVSGCPKRSISSFSDPFHGILFCYNLFSIKPDVLKVSWFFETVYVPKSCLFVMEFCRLCFLAIWFSWQIRFNYSTTQ
jgi:hypothetical protein